MIRLAATAALLLTAALVPAQAQSWVDRLQSIQGAICCSNNDGRRLDDPDWDTLGKVNDEFSGYRVYENGAWYEVPVLAVVSMRNQDGIPRVWWNLTTDDAGYVTGRSIRCFLAGATG